MDRQTHGYIPLGRGACIGMEKMIEMQRERERCEAREEVSRWTEKRELVLLLLSPRTIEGDSRRVGLEIQGRLPISFPPVESSDVDRDSEPLDLTPPRSKKKKKERKNGRKKERRKRKKPRMNKEERRNARQIIRKEKRSRLLLCCSHTFELPTSWCYAYLLLILLHVLSLSLLRLFFPLPFRLLLFLSLRLLTDLRGRQGQACTYREKDRCMQLKALGINWKEHECLINSYLLVDNSRPTKHKQQRAAVFFSRSFYLYPFFLSFFPSLSSPCVCYMCGNEAKKTLHLSSLASSSLFLRPLQQREISSKYVEGGSIYLSSIYPSLIYLGSMFNLPSCYHCAIPSQKWRQTTYPCDMQKMKKKTKKNREKKEERTRHILYQKLAESKDACAPSTRVMKNNIHPQEEEEEKVRQKER